MSRLNQGLGQSAKSCTGVTSCLKIACIAERTEINTKKGNQVDMTADDADSEAVALTLLHFALRQTDTVEHTAHIKLFIRLILSERSTT